MTPQNENANFITFAQTEYITQNDSLCVCVCVWSVDCVVNQFPFHLPHRT